MHVLQYSKRRDCVKKAVQEEMEGPGQYLGYRAMQRKLREQHQLAAPRNSVDDVMGMVDPEGLERRGNVGQKKRGSGRFLFAFISSCKRFHTFCRLLISTKKD